MLCRTGIFAMLGPLALAIAAAADPQSFSPRDSYLRAQAAFDQKNYQEAATLAQNAEREHPAATDALVLRAKALIHLQQHEQAEKDLRHYMQTHQHSSDAAYLLAYVLFRRNLPTQSLAAYTAAARLQRPAADDLKIVGLDYALLNDYPDAIRWLERARSEAPNESEIAYHLGRAYYIQNNFDKSIEMFERCLVLDPSSAKAKNNLGLALEGKNQVEQAENAYRDAIRLAKETGYESDQPYLNLAQLLSHKSRSPEALQMIETAERVGGHSEKSEELRGKILLAEDRLPEAEQAFRAALQLEPNNGSLHYQLARVLRREGKEEEAKVQFQKTQTLLGTRSAPN